ncbi:GGDEF domain-containing protein [Candidatus Saccharibacteria bacterium]|nr:GGDEF domain-containing protein [Candidatus Saccharibacteria bacterium]
MFETTIDCAFVLLLANKVPIAILYVVKEVEIIINPTLAFLVFDIFYDKRTLRQDKTMQKLRKVIHATIVANAILQSLAIFGLNVFYIDDKLDYHRGPLVFVYVLLLLIGVVALECGMLVFSSKTQSTMKITLLSFTALLLTSILLRAFFYDNNYDFLCLSASTPFLLIYYSHVTLRVDPVTKLLNRQVYSKFIKRIDYTTIIIMIDANNFKQINDTFGHECGDQTLWRLANIICKTYGQYAYCFRIGGDEFCAILKPEVFSKLTEETPYRDAYSAAEKFMSRLDVAIKAEAKKVGQEAYLKFGVSQGHGVYYSQTDYPTTAGQTPIEDVIKMADRRMYQSKESFKEQYGKLDDAPMQDISRPKVHYEPASVELVQEESDEATVRQTPNKTFIQHAQEIKNIQHVDELHVD